MGTPSSAQNLDFKVDYIEVRAYSDKWGPFYWDVSNYIPSGDVLSAVTVKTYQDDDSSDNDGDDTTSLLVEPSTETVVAADDQVYCEFQYPGVASVGLHRVELQATFTSGAKHTYKFGYVRVQA